MFKWLNVSIIWAIKVGTNPTQEEVLAVEDIGSQLQQREALSQYRRLGTMPNLLISRPCRHVPINSNVHLTTQFLKVVHHNMTTLLLERINIWNNVLHMNGYYVEGVIAISYNGFRCIIIVVSNENKTYIVSIAYNPHRTCHNFAKMSSMAMGKRGKVGFIQTFVIFFSR